MILGIARILAFVLCFGGFGYLLFNIQRISETWAQPVNDVLGFPGVFAIPFVWALFSGVLVFWIDKKCEALRLLQNTRR